MIPSGLQALVAEETAFTNAVAASRAAYTHDAAVHAELLRAMSTWTNRYMRLEALDAELASLKQ